LAGTITIDGIISVGDNIYPNGVSSIYDPQWNDNFENVYNLENIKDIPWYVALGNHDYVLNDTAQIQYTFKSINNKWNMPNRYFKKIFEINDLEKIVFYILDTTPYDIKLRSQLPNLQIVNRTEQWNGLEKSWRIWIQL